MARISVVFKNPFVSCALRSAAELLLHFITKGPSTFNMSDLSLLQRIRSALRGSLGEWLFDVQTWGEGLHSVEPCTFATGSFTTVDG